VCELATALVEEVETVDRKARGTSPPGAVAKRFGVNLRRPDVERLYDIAGTYDITPTEVIRRAIATEYKLLKIIEEGGQVLAKKANDQLLELDLRY